MIRDEREGKLSTSSAHALLLKNTQEINTVRMRIHSFAVANSINADKFLEQGASYYAKALQTYTVDTAAERAEILAARQSFTEAAGKLISEINSKLR